MASHPLDIESMSKTDRAVIDHHRVRAREAWETQTQDPFESEGWLPMNSAPSNVNSNHARSSYERLIGLGVLETKQVEEDRQSTRRRYDGDSLTYVEEPYSYVWKLSFARLTESYRQTPDEYLDHYTEAAKHHEGLVVRYREIVAGHDQEINSSWDEVETAVMMRQNVLDAVEQGQEEEAAQAMLAAEQKVNALRISFKGMASNITALLRHRLLVARAKAMIERIQSGDS